MNTIEQRMALRKVLVVVGTTGAGKTKLSIDLAKAVGGEIINSDAMQVRFSHYRSVLQSSWQ